MTQRTNSRRGSQPHAQRACATRSPPRRRARVTRRCSDAPRSSSSASSRRHQRAPASSSSPPLEWNPPFEGREGSDASEHKPPRREGRRHDAALRRSRGRPDPPLRGPRGAGPSLGECLRVPGISASGASAECAATDAHQQTGSWGTALQLGTDSHVGGSLPPRVPGCDSGAGICARSQVLSVGSAGQPRGDVSAVDRGVAVAFGKTRKAASEGLSSTLRWTGLAAARAVDVGPTPTSAPVEGRFLMPKAARGRRSAKRWCLQLHPVPLVVFVRACSRPRLTIAAHN